MLNKGLLAIVTLMAAGAQAPSPSPGSALKASIRLTIAKTDAPFAASPYSNFGPLLAQLLTPNGPVTIDYVIAPDESRAELGGRLATLNSGTVVLEHAGDTMLRVLNPENKTWYEIPAGGNPGTTLGLPDVRVQPTTDAAIIAGQEAQRFGFTETMQVPPPPGAATRAAPTELRFSGDVWSTTAFSGSGYAGVIKTLQAFATIPGIEALTAGGRFPLRLVLRSNVMPGYEMRSEVLSIREVPVDPAAFAVPADYLHVVPPGR